MKILEKANNLDAMHFSSEYVDAFWSKVDKSRSCWHWTGVTNGTYGLAKHPENSKKKIIAHRVSLAVCGHSVPTTMMVDHICMNKICVNPAHLRVVTPRINALENSGSITAKLSQRTECPKGHKYIEGNFSLRRYKNGWVSKVCLGCKRDYNKRWKERNPDYFKRRKQKQKDTNELLPPHR